MAGVLGFEPTCLRMLILSHFWCASFFGEFLSVLKNKNIVDLFKKVTKDKEQEAKQEGLEKRDFTTQFNADICNKIFTLIRNIDLTEVKSFEI